MRCAALPDFPSRPGGLDAGGRAVWPVLVLAFAAGGATVGFETALAITVRDLFAGPRLMPANSWLEAANQGGQMIGPGVAGLLAAAGLLRGAMLIDALTFGVSLASLAALRGGYRAVARTGEARRLPGSAAPRPC